MIFSLNDFIPQRYCIILSAFSGKYFVMMGSVWSQCFLSHSDVALNHENIIDSAKRSIKNANNSIFIQLAFHCEVVSSIRNRHNQLFPRRNHELKKAVKRGWNLSLIDFKYLEFNTKSKCIDWDSCVFQFSKCKLEMSKVQNAKCEFHYFIHKFIPHDSTYLKFSTFPLSFWYFCW